MLAHAALEKKALDVVILDLRGRIYFADLYVVCTATNPRQVSAIADEVRRVAKREHGRVPSSVEGREACKWILVDFSDVVVHVFDQSSRGFYDLDGLWSDAPRLPVPEVEGAASDDPLFPFR
ncbi:MAG: ribosome silencing factor [Proteobacteria bacterium]|nr:ribosome silencing factor [Pseudomonadota bacterium]